MITACSASLTLRLYGSNTDIFHATALTPIRRKYKPRMTANPAKPNLQIKFSSSSSPTEYIKYPNSISPPNVRTVASIFNLVVCWAVRRGALTLVFCTSCSVFTALPLLSRLN